MTDTGIRVVMCFFFNDTATTEIYTLSLHDALPICDGADRQLDLARGHALVPRARPARHRALPRNAHRERLPVQDRKSTRLNSSHANISYAVFCLKKKKTTSSTSTTTYNLIINILFY